LRPFTVAYGFASQCHGNENWSVYGCLLIVALKQSYHIIPCYKIKVQMKAPVNSSILLSVASYSREQKQLASICYHQLMHPHVQLGNAENFRLPSRSGKAICSLWGCPEVDGR